MTAHYVDQEIDFDTVSHPIQGNTKTVVEHVANDWDSDEDWANFRRTCEVVADWDDGVFGYVDPASVRQAFADSDVHIPPRRLSAFYHRAASKSGFLDFSHWGLNTDTKGRNAGRPARIYKLRT